jgi:hypothetical protein
VTASRPVSVDHGDHHLRMITARTAGAGSSDSEDHGMGFLDELKDKAEGATAVVNA